MVNARTSATEGRTRPTPIRAWFRRRVDRRGGRTRVSARTLIGRTARGGSSVQGDRGARLGSLALLALAYDVSCDLVAGFLGRRAGILAPLDDGHDHVGQD